MAASFLVCGTGLAGAQPGTIGALAKQAADDAIVIVVPIQETGRVDVVRAEPAVIEQGPALSVDRSGDAPVPPETQPTPARTANNAVPAPPAPPAPKWTADEDLQLSILKEITARKMRGADDATDRQLNELGTLYASEFASPLWVDENGVTAKAYKAAAEFARAEEWGLEPSTYRIDLPEYGFHVDGEKARFEIEFALNLLKYVDHARRGRFRPTEMSLWYEGASNKTDHMELLRHLAKTEDPTALLVAQHPQHEGFKNLRRVYLSRKWPDRFPLEPVEDLGPQPITLEFDEAVYRGKRHPQIPLLRERLKVPASNPDEEDLYDRELMNAVNSFMRTQGWRRKHVYDNKVRKALNQSNGTSSKKRKTRVSTEDIVANMEKWRWMPRELGDMHIWNNLPSFKTQVVRDGEVIHEERIIIGKTDTQTPVFSDTMTHVVFRPQWGVPNSIKVKSLLPRLAGGDYDVLRRRGMRIQYGDQVKSPRNYNWSRTDIRHIPIVMGAGSSNPLGHVKFMFPNHHAVYMHDTNKRWLFKNSKRTFSHGCIRVRDPARFAEVVLSGDGKWSPAQVRAYMKTRAKENNRVDLPRKIHVHNTYFTVLADKNGDLSTLSDIYGHDKRIKQALAGKSLKLIARSDPARAQKREIEQIAQNRTRYAASSKTRKTRRSRSYQASFSAPYALGGPSYTKNKPKRRKAYRKRRKQQIWTINPFQPY